MRFRKQAARRRDQGEPTETADTPLTRTAAAAGRGPRTATFWLPRCILDRSWRLLRQDGLKGVESTVLLGGRRIADEAFVMAVLYPCGHDVELDHGFVHVGPDAVAEMGRWLRAQGLTALIQVHTHPGAWTGHSPTDDDFPIASSDGFISIVWPHFAAHPVTDVGQLGVHRLNRGEWHLLPPDEARRAIRVLESEVMVWTHTAPSAPTRAGGSATGRLISPVTKDGAK